jgi:hypothetical protein
MQKRLKRPERLVLSGSRTIQQMDAAVKSAQQKEVFRSPAAEPRRDLTA